MEPQLFLLLRGFRIVAQEILNQKFRWLRLRLAAGDEVALSPRLEKQNWTAWCACDGSGIYNGGFGPLPLRLQRRKKGRDSTQSQRYTELMIGGQEVTLCQMQFLLSVLMDYSDEVIVALRHERIDSSEAMQIIGSAPQFNIDTDLPNQITVFTNFDQTVRLVRGSNEAPSTNI